MINVLVPNTTPISPPFITVVDATVAPPAGTDVIVFDADHPAGEKVEVMDKTGNVLKVVPRLRNSYHCGRNWTGNPNGRLAAVATPSFGFYEWPNVTGYLTDAFGGDTDGKDGGCFVEFVELSGGVKVPRREQYTATDPLYAYPGTWWTTKPYEVNVLSAKWKNVVADTFALSSPAEHWMALFCEQLNSVFTTPKEGQKAGGKVAAHEFMHIISGDNDCQHPVAWDNAAGKPCLMYSPPPTIAVWSNGHAEGHKDHLYKVRDNPADF